MKENFEMHEKAKPITRIIFQILLAILISDIFAAVGHWAEDNYLPYGTTLPILRNIAFENELHHFSPRSITYCSYVENCKTMIALTLIFLLFCRFALKIKFESAPAFYITSAFMGSCINLFHRFCHERDCERPKVITALQNVGLLVSPKTHRQHHIDNKAHRNYGIILEPLNTFYDGCNLWENLEHLLSKCNVTTCPKRGVHAYPASKITNDTSDCPEPMTQDTYESLKHELTHMYEADDLETCPKKM